MAGIPVYDQETTISFTRDSDACLVYTSDSTVMTKLDKLAESDKAPHWKLIGEQKLKGRNEIVSKTYETHKRLISFRADISTRELNDEQIEARAQRMRQYHEQRRNKEN